MPFSIFFPANQKKCPPAILLRQCTLRSLLLGLTTITTICPGSAHSEILFKENFDELPYTLNQPVPTAPNVLDIGEWKTKPEDGSGTLITQAFSLSKNHSVALGAASGLAANFGDSAGAPVAEPLRVRFSFCFVEDVDAEAYVYTKDGVLVAYAQIAAARPDAFIRAWMDGKADEHREHIDPHVWYTVEFRLPAHPGSDGEYELRVWESTQPEPDMPIARGKFYQRPETETSYRILTTSNQNTELQNPIYLDNYLIETFSE